MTGNRYAYDAAEEAIEEMEDMMSIESSESTPTPSSSTEEDWFSTEESFEQELVEEEVVFVGEE